jgi:hypothetical protein
MEGPLPEILAGRLQGVPPAYIEKLAAWLDALGEQLQGGGLSPHGLVPASGEALPGGVATTEDLRAVADLLPAPQGGGPALPGAPSVPDLPGLPKTGPAPDGLDPEALQEATGDAFVPADPGDRREAAALLAEIRTLDGAAEGMLATLQGEAEAFGPALAPLAAALAALLKPPEVAGPPPEAEPPVLDEDPEKAAAFLDAKIEETERSVQSQQEELAAMAPASPAPPEPEAPEVEEPPSPQAPELGAPKTPEMEGEAQQAALAEDFEKTLGQIAEGLDAMKVDKGDILGGFSL